ncbi:MAG: hypothetical protein J5878_07295 [Oscillospiraceae bacterium]|nr:hypothetical protein [Oscillospiraceae bacterium]
MKGVYVGEKPLNVLSCAVEGRPGRSAYELAAAGGYSGTEAQYEAFLGGLPGVVNQLNNNKLRIEAIVELLEGNVSELQLTVTDLARRVQNLEGGL